MVERMNSEDITLTPDLSLLWGKVLRKLRENNEHMLHAAAAEINNIEFTSDEIIIYCPNEPLYALLSKYKKQLNEYAQADVIRIVPPSKGSSKSENIEKLKKLFGEKIVIKN